MKKIVANCILMLACVCLFNIAGAFGQPAGSPILTNSHKEFTVSIDGGYFTKGIAGVRNSSRSYLLRAIYGLSGQLDFFGQMGLVKLDLEASNATKFHDKHRFAYGGGFTWLVTSLQSMRTSIFLGGQALRFKSNPHNDELLSIANSELIRILELEYDWREINLYLGMNKDLNILNLYLGVNTKLLVRDELRKNRLVLNGTGVSSAETFGKYRSGILISPMLGVDLNASARLKLSFELAGNNKRDFTFFLGISQTGSP